MGEKNSGPLKHSPGGEVALLRKKTESCPKTFSSNNPQKKFEDHSQNIFSLWRRAKGAVQPLRAQFCSCRMYYLAWQHRSGTGFL